jgi:hypothetical protein
MGIFYGTDTLKTFAYDLNKRKFDPGKMEVHCVELQQSMWVV